MIRSKPYGECVAICSALMSRSVRLQERPPPSPSGKSPPNPRGAVVQPIRRLRRIRGAPSLSAGHRLNASAHKKTLTLHLGATPRLSLVPLNLTPRRAKERTNETQVVLPALRHALLLLPDSGVGRAGLLGHLGLEYIQKQEHRNDVRHANHSQNRADRKAFNRSRSLEVQRTGANSGPPV